MLRPLDSYNSLTDEYLVDYFNNKRIRKHLRQMGLITRRGEVVDEPTFRYNTARKEHRTHVKELMSQAVINKTLELERNRRAFIRDKLIEIRKIETVNRVKRDRDTYLLDYPQEKSTRPKSAPSRVKQGSDAECVAGVSIPPGSTVKWVPLIVPPYGSTPYLALSGVPDHAVPKRRATSRVQNGRSKSSSSEGEKQSNREYKPRCATPRSARSAESKKPRCVLVNNFTNEGSSVKFESDVTLSTVAFNPPPHSHIYQTYSSPDIQPLVPGVKNLPARPKSALARSKRNHNQIKQRPKSASSATPVSPYNQQQTSFQQPFVQRRQIHSMSKITLRYLGKSLDLSSGIFGDAVEVMIMQQHCGGNTVCVYQGLVSPNECFTFTSRRHRDAPFGITIYVGSMMDTRLSTCCEYKHKPGHILGGKSGHFALVRVEGCLPCYKCFAHVDELKKQQTAAHTKFQEDVKYSKDPKKPSKGKKKKASRTKKGSSSTSSSSDNEDEKPILEATVTVKQRKETVDRGDRTPTKVPNNHVIEDPQEEDIRKFEKLVVKSDHPDDDEDVLVLHSSDSEEEEQASKPTVKEEVLKLESESSSSDDEKESAPPADHKEAKVNGYEDEEFHSEEDNKSDISVASSKSEGSVKSNSSVKSSASVKSDDTIKSGASIKSESSGSSTKSNKSDSSKKSDRSSSSSTSSVKSDKENSSVSSIKSEDSMRNKKVDVPLPVEKPQQSASEATIDDDKSSPITTSSVQSALSSTPSEASVVPEKPTTVPESVTPVPSELPIPLSKSVEALAEPTTEPPPTSTEASVESPSKSPEPVPVVQIAEKAKEVEKKPKDEGPQPKEDVLEKKEEARRQDAGLGAREPLPQNESDNESEMSIHSNHSNHSNRSNNSDTTTSSYVSDASASATQLKVLSPTQSILSTDSSKSKDPNRRIRFSDTVIQRVASDDEDY